MKTITMTKRIHLPEGNLWQWADEKRAARIRQAESIGSPARRMAKGILARFYSLLGNR